MSAVDDRSEIGRLAAEALGVEGSEVESLFEVPADRAMGDLALPCFRLAKALKKNPKEIAERLARGLAGKLPDSVAGMEAVGPYVNFRLDPFPRMKRLLAEIVEKGGRFGADETVGAEKTVVLDFSSPNIAKPFSIGHLRSTVIGHATANIMEFLGYDCIRVNHLGDWGTQFGKLIAAYKLWGDDEALEGDFPIQALLALYIRFHQEAETDPALDDLGRGWFKRLEDGDPEAKALWERFHRASLAEFDKTYTRLGVRFDVYTGESFYNDKMEAVIRRLEEKGLLVESRGARIVDLEPYGMTPVVIQRSDDASLYATRDLAAAYYRRETYGFHKNLYFVATQQNEHFAQIFKVLELLGEPWAVDCVHVPFGMIRFPEGAMSTRKGNVVFLEKVLDQAIERVDRIMAEKNPDLPGRERVAEQVGIGAIVFYDLSRRRIKDWNFEWDLILNFDGETGPYVMYSHARLRSILRKAAERGIGPFESAENLDRSALDSEEAVGLLQSMESFQEALLRAAEGYEPSVLAQCLVDIADRSNRFYNAHHVLVEDERVARSRLLLVACVAQVLRTGLHLLGISAPEEM